MVEKVDIVDYCKKCLESGDDVGFAISGAPAEVVLAFMSDIDRRYNGTYWVKLMDLMRKAEAYDAMIAYSQPVVKPVSKEGFEDKPDEESETCKTFSGVQTKKKKR